MRIPDVWAGKLMGEHWDRFQRMTPEEKIKELAKIEEINEQSRTQSTEEKGEEDNETST